MKRLIPTGSKHWNWKGDSASYRSIHYWIVRHLAKPDECSRCGKETNKLDCANISGKYRTNGS